MDLQTCKMRAIRSIIKAADRVFHHMRVTVIGTGYVGTVTGACLSYFGHRVTCVDTDAQKIEKLRRGEMPIYEPGLDELLRLAAARGGIAFTTELAAPVAASDVVFIAVGTPSHET